MESKLEFPQSAILTPYNYFEWKPKIQLHLRSRGLFRITMETEVEPTSAMEKTRYFNRMDEAFGILCLSISPELLFHVESCSTPNEVWKILEELFGKQDEMQGHILENELNSLDPRNFENIQDFFTRYKALLVQLKGCGIDKSKQENQLILSILSKLGPEYAVFVSTFHTVRSATGAAWKMPSLDSFIQSLMHEQDKLIKMGTLKNSKAHALTVHAKGKANPKPPDGSSGSKERKGTKGKSMCNYCHRGFHPESACMKKTIDLMAQTLQQYNLEDHIPENAKKKSEEKAPDPREKARHPRGNGHALIALHSAPQEWIIDSGASHHMASSKESFSFLHAYSGPPILMGDNSAVAATGQGRVQFEDGRFENVLHTPRLAVNLLSVYQMTHTGSGRKVEFTPDSVSIYDMQTNLKIASGKVNDQSRLYTFSDFVPQSDSILLLTHANEENRTEVYEFYRASTPYGCSPSEVGGTMQEIFRPAEVHVIKKILWLLSTPLGTFLLAGKLALASEFPFVKRFGDLSLEAREQVLQDWSTSSLSFFRTIFKAFKNNVAWNHFTRVNESGHNHFWKAIGYCGLDPVAMSATLTPKSLEDLVINVSGLSTEDLDMALKNRAFNLTVDSYFANTADAKSSDHVLECDVVIVGSGSGGGVTAAVLAKSGFKVVILEKGGYIAWHELPLLEREAIRDLYEEGKLLTTDDQGMIVMAGSTVGGGSAVNWYASFRTPEHVLREWNEDLNLPLFGSKRYRDAMDEVCNQLGVQVEINRENFQNTVLRTGCEKLGYHVANIPINATPDHSCGWCTFGCRRGMKQGTSETWLVDAAKAGAVILTRCHAQRVLHSDGTRGKPRKAIGVVAKIGGNEDRHLIIKSRTTVVACGSLQTPLLLQRSGLKNPHIGKNLHLHPVQIVWGYFSQGTAPEGSFYEGEIMTAFSNEAANWQTSGYGALIQTPSLHPGTFVAAIPWKSSSSYKESMAKYS